MVPQPEAVREVVINPVVRKGAVVKQEISHWEEGAPSYFLGVTPEVKTVTGYES